MSRRRKPTYFVRPQTAILTRGFDPGLSLGSARPAVFRSSTYVFTSPEAAERAFGIALGKTSAQEGERVDLIYARLSHPNAEIVEDQIVPLEPGASSAAVFNSGMAAISTLCLTFCHPGETIIYTDPIYGGTHHLIHQMLAPLGITSVAIAAGDTASLAKAVAETPNVSLVLIETPANPTLRMTDIRSASEAAASRAVRPLIAVDNTFMGPAFQHPLNHGADLVVYSATKYLAGFSDMLAGLILAKDPELTDTLRGTRAILGNILQPDESWLLDQRLPTVMFRMNRQSKNAQRIVDALSKHPQIQEFHHPSRFEDTEQKRIRDAQCTFGGAMFAMELKGGKRAAFDFLRKVRLARNAVSLGGVETLACHPATTTHSEMTDEELKRSGVTGGLVRVSVGIEDWRDLLADLRQALDSLGPE
jgi:methionine-gamma-lyase